jgi:hypothetical protein
MHQIALSWNNNDDGLTSLQRRRVTSRPFSSASGFMITSFSEISE